MSGAKNRIFLINLLITMVAVSPAVALGEGNRNMLLIVVMGICPLLLVQFPKFNPKVDIPLLGILSMMMGFSLVFHPGTMRWSTVLYSCMFGLYFMAYCRVLLSSKYALSDFLGILRFLIYAYCIVLIIQQFCVLFGLPIFNISNYDPQTPWKLNSLTAEPSHSARILPLLMYIYVSLKQHCKNVTLIQSYKENKKVWLAFLWCVLTMGSATAFLFLLLIVLKFFNVIKLLKSFRVIALGIIAVVIMIQSAPFQRFWSMMQVIYTLDPEILMETDHSASGRIVPSIYAFKEIGMSSQDDWFGHGVDADSKIVEKMPGVSEAGGGLFTLWINFGLIVSLSWWLMTYKICKIRGNIVPVLFWFFCVVMYGGLNNQIVWLTLMLFYTYKKLNKQFIFQK